MEVSGTVFRPLLSLIGSGKDSNSPAASLSVLSFDDARTNHRLSFQILGSRRRRRKVLTHNSGFSDMGHLQYYSSSDPTTLERRIRCGSAQDKDIIKEEEKKKKKMRSKLISLSRDLAMFSDFGFALHNHHGLEDQDKGNMSKEAAELLLGQLQQLKAEEGELKRKRKEEKAKLKAAAQMQKMLDCETSSSSSSSSESSDSECGEVVDMSSLSGVASLAPSVVDDLRQIMEDPASPLPNTLTEEASLTELQSVVREAHATLTIPSPTNVKGTSTEEEGGIIGSCLHHIEQPCFSTRSTNTTNCNGGVGGVASSSAKKVEVCMGGKCKKSGAASLLDEFQRVLGAEASIVGCKCMGKCRDGPNVRILNYSGVQAECVTVKVPSNPLCIGVGFEDVSLIVTNFLGEQRKGRSLAAAS